MVSPITPILSVSRTITYTFTVEFSNNVDHWSELFFKLLLTYSNSLSFILSFKFYYPKSNSWLPKTPLLKFILFKILLTTLPFQYALNKLPVNSSPLSSIIKSYSFSYYSPSIIFAITLNPPTTYFSFVSLLYISCPYMKPWMSVIWINNNQLILSSFYFYYESIQYLLISIFFLYI